MLAKNRSLNQKVNQLSQENKELRQMNVNTTEQIPNLASKQQLNLKISGLNRQINEISKGSDALREESIKINSKIDGMDSRMMQLQANLEKNQESKEESPYELQYHDQVWTDRYHDGTYQSAVYDYYHPGTLRPIARGFWMELEYSCSNEKQTSAGCQPRIKTFARYTCCGENNNGCRVGWKCCNNQNQTAPGCKSMTVTKINDSIYETNDLPKQVYLPGNKRIHIRKFK